MNKQNKLMNNQNKILEDDIVEKFQDDNRDVRTMLNEYERVIIEEEKALRKLLKILNQIQLNVKYQILMIM